MVENHIEQPAAGTVTDNPSLNAIGQRFFDDANSQSTGSVWGRRAEVTVKGLEHTPEGAAKAAVDMLKPENYGKDAMLLASSAVVGSVLRVALPESGALKAGVGILMTGYFLKDAIKPIGEAWDKVSHDGRQSTMDAASRQMGNGVGDFLVQGGISMAAAGVAAKFTPGVMEAIAPKTWSKIEGFKTGNLGQAATVDVAPRSAETFYGKPAPQAAPESTGLRMAMGETGERAVKTGPSVRDMTSEQITEALATSRANEAARITSGNLSRFGIKGSDGNFHDRDDVAQLLLAGKDPSVEPAGPRTAKTVPLAKTDLTRPENLVISEKTAPAAGDQNVGDMAVRKGGGGRSPKSPGDGTPTATPTDTALRRPTDAATDTPVKVTDANRILNAKTMAAQAASIKSSLDVISDQDGLIMDAMNRSLGAIDVRTNPNVKPLAGYDVPRKAAFELAAQVGTDPANFMQVKDLYERFAAGALQSGTAETSDIAAHVARMDLYAKENFETYRDNIIKAGIDPNVALAQKPTAPLVEGTSDVQQIGVDADGNPVFAHEGPHTVRAIYGPNGEPVWPLDMVKTPIREILMRGTSTSGIYGHEFMHDQFGHLAEFDPEVRDAKLGDAAAKAWGADADKQVSLPNGGKSPQQVLLDAVVRKMEKVPAEQQDAFLTDQLGLDPRTKVIRAARAADDILGDVGKKMVQVPGSGPMPLELFVGNIAAMADDRAPSAVLAELQGKGNATETAQAVSAKVDQILGPNGKQALPLSDGSHITLKDLVMKVSDETRNPKFDTYDKALPATMSNKDILVNVAKAWADETFADWGAAAESGQTAAPYFQALSKTGQLRTSTVMGQEMRSDANPLGIEAHPTDVLRPRYQAALVRALATAKGGHDQMLLDWADALDDYARKSAPPGPVTLPSLDTPGQSIQIPQEVFDKFIPELVEAQLNTPLPRLQGRTLFDILPDLRKNFRINQGIADSWSSAIEAGKGPESIANFDASKTKITHVFGAGQLTFLKLVSDGMDPDKARDAVNAFSDHFGDEIVKDRAAAPAVAPAQAPKPLQFAAMAAARPVMPDGPFHAKALQPGMVAADAGPLLAGAGDFTRASATPASSSALGSAARWAWKAASSPEATAALTTVQVNELIGMYKMQQELSKEKDGQ